MLDAMNVQPPTYTDPTLRWSMRLTGLLLAVSAAFFLMKDLVVGPTDDIAFGVATALGFLTFASSFWPARRAPQPEIAIARSAKPSRRTLRPVGSSA